MSVGIGPNSGQGLNAIVPQGIETAQDKGKSILSQLFFSKALSGLEQSLNLSGMSIEQTMPLSKIAPLPDKIGTLGPGKGK